MRRLHWSLLAAALACGSLAADPLGSPPRTGSSPAPSNCRTVTDFDRDSQGDVLSEHPLSNQEPAPVEPPQEMQAEPDDQLPREQSPAPGAPSGPVLEKQQPKSTVPVPDTDDPDDSVVPS